MTDVRHPRVRIADGNSNRAPECNQNPIGVRPGSKQKTTPACSRRRCSSACWSTFAERWRCSSACCRWYPCRHWCCSAFSTQCLPTAFVFVVLPVMYDGGAPQPAGNGGVASCGFCLGACRPCGSGACKLRVLFISNHIAEHFLEYFSPLGEMGCGHVE